MKAKNKNAKRYLISRQDNSDEGSRANANESFDTSRLKEFMKVINTEPNKKLT